MNLGSFRIDPLWDGYLVFPAPHGFPSVDSPEYSAHSHYIQSDGRWRMTLGAFLVRLPGRTILIDAGSGPDRRVVIRPPCFSDPRAAPQAIRAYHDMLGLDHVARKNQLAWLAETETCHGFLLDSLSALGVPTEAVTDIVLSHLHFDHIGWLSAKGAAVFPNATFRVERRDLDHFLRPEQAIEDAYYQAAWGVVPTAERLEPILARIEPWDGDVALAPGLNALFTPGHTPGHSVFILSSGTERMMMLGDVAHCPLQLTDVDFSVMADMDPTLADRQREWVRREIAGTATLVAGAHFPDLRFGRLLAGQGRSGWVYAK
jgi:glyoxylase-like metal-dependent hydrolase (beta-lactamase superfamily II)